MVILAFDNWRRWSQQVWSSWHFTSFNYQMPGWPYLLASPPSIIKCQDDHTCCLHLLQLSNDSLTIPAGFTSFNYQMPGWPYLLASPPSIIKCQDDHTCCLPLLQLSNARMTIPAGFISFNYQMPGWPYLLASPPSIGMVILAFDNWRRWSQQVWSSWHLIIEGGKGSRYGHPGIW
jgi:hypothetical protein